MLDPQKALTIGIVFPVGDLQLAPEQLANLDEEDLPRLSELVCEQPYRRFLMRSMK